MFGPVETASYGTTPSVPRQTLTGGVSLRCRADRRSKSFPCFPLRGAIVPPHLRPIPRRVRDSMHHGLHSAPDRGGDCLRRDVHRRPDARGGGGQIPSSSLLGRGRSHTHAPDGRVPEGWRVSGRCRLGLTHLPASFVCLPHGSLCSAGRIVPVGMSWGSPWGGFGRYNLFRRSLPVFLFVGCSRRDGS